METIILHNGGKGVANYIMNSSVFVAMSVMEEVDTHKVNGVCAHASRDARNWEMG